MSKFFLINNYRFSLESNRCSLKLRNTENSQDKNKFNLGKQNIKNINSKNQEVFEHEQNADFVLCDKMFAKVSLILFVIIFQENIGDKKMKIFDERMERLKKQVRKLSDNTKIVIGELKNHEFADVVKRENSIFELKLNNLLTQVYDVIEDQQEFLKSDINFEGSW